MSGGKEEKKKNRNSKRKKLYCFHLLFFQNMLFMLAMVWFGLVLWYINHLRPNHFYTYILDIFLNTFWRYHFQTNLSSPSFVFFFFCYFFLLFFFFVYLFCFVVVAVVLFFLFLFVWFLFGSFFFCFVFLFCFVFVFWGFFCTQMNGFTYFFLIRILLFTQTVLFQTTQFRMSTKLNGSKNWYISPIIQLNISHLFTLS